ncbi:unnamed protein product [Colias eurytheme]|nr:unnamed protein product [Colias eurytheme]
MIFPRLVSNPKCKNKRRGMTVYRVYTGTALRVDSSHWPLRSAYQPEQAFSALNPARPRIVTTRTKHKTL